MGHLGNLKWETLEQFTERQANIAATCLRCRRRTTLDAQKLARYFAVMRWPTAIHQVALHLYCSQCGNRPDKLRPCRKLPDAPQFLPTTEAEWIRLIRRLRR
jgi:hypothetical protein